MSASNEQLQQQLSLDEAWDNICVNPHQLAFDIGRQRGREDGLVAGYSVGYRIGRTKALDYGTEIGFVRGVVLALEQDDHDNAEGSTERLQKLLAGVRAALDDFPGPEESFRGQSTKQQGADDHSNHEIDDDSETAPENSSLDVAGKMQRIRARFKLLTVRLGCPHFSLKQVMDDAASEATLRGPQPVEISSEW